MAGAHSQFMEDFVDWLDKQPGVKTAREIDASMLYATAFEFTAIGASRLTVAVAVGG